MPRAIRRHRPLRNFALRAGPQKSLPRCVRLQSRRFIAPAIRAGCEYPPARAPRFRSVGVTVLNAWLLVAALALIVGLLWNLNRTTAPTPASRPVAQTPLACNAPMSPCTPASNSSDLGARDFVIRQPANAPQAPAALPERDPFLKVADGQLHDGRGTGDAIYLRGTNLGSWLLFESWMCPMDAGGLKDDWSVRDALTRRFDAQTKDRLLYAYEDAWLQETDFDNIAALGMNVVRLPFWYLNLQEEDGTWRDDAFKRIDWVIEKAWQRGLYVILDFHGAPGGQSDGDTTGRIRKKKENGLEPDFWKNESNIQRGTEIWTRIAERYKGNPAVAAYDLLNEPTGAPNREALWSLYDRWYKAIRAVDPDHIISLEGCWGGQVEGKYMGWGWNVLPPPQQFGWTNVWYQQHSYEWDWNNLEKQKRNSENQVNEWLQHKDWKVPCLIGEFNCMGQGWAYTIEKYCANDMSWTVWTYKATHGGLQDSWGIYNPKDPWPPKPDIRKDSAEAIQEKWSKWTTANAFGLNPNHKKNLAMPVPVNDEYTATVGKTLTAKPGVLANDKHLNLNEPQVKLTARLVSGPAHGTLKLEEDGSFTYAPGQGFTGADAFRYRAFDGRLDSARIGVVTIRVEE